MYSGEDVITMPKKRGKKQDGAEGDEDAQAATTTATEEQDPRVAALEADDKVNDGKPHIVRGVTIGERVYKPGEEEELAEVFKDNKDGKDQIERLTAKGAIVGF